VAATSEAPARRGGLTPETCLSKGNNINRGSVIQTTEAREKRKSAPTSLKKFRPVQRKMWRQLSSSGEKGYYLYI
jgi:hypothetical protein